MRRAGMNQTQLLDDANRIRFTEWIRRKEAENRMRNKLISKAKNEIREEVYALA